MNRGTTALTMDIDISECLKVDHDNVCRGCLSKDRVLKCLRDDLDLLFTLLGYTEACSTIYESPLLCWECLALLNNVKKFQSRVKRAHNLFKKVLYDSDPTYLTTLSTLSPVKIETPNYIFDHETCQEEKLAAANLMQISSAVAVTSTKPEEILFGKPEDLIQNLEFPSTIKEEKDDNWEDSEWNIDDADYSETEIKREPKQEIERDRRKNKKCPGKEARREFRKKVKVIKGVKIGDNIQKLYKVEYLNLDEMERFVVEDNNRDRQGKKKWRWTKCKYCTTSFSKAQDVNRHRLVCHFDKLNCPLKCEECSTVCETEESLRAHWRLHNAVYRCGVCAEIYRSPRQMQVHMTRHDKFFVCTACDVTMLSHTAMRQHYDLYHKCAVCDHCGKEFKTKRAVENHIRLHHMPETCIPCNRVFSNRVKFLRHHTSVHGWQVVTGGDLAYCVECNKQFKGRKQYLAHVTSSLKHAPEKRVSIPCPECGKTFSRRVYFNNHYKLFHLKKSNHYCPDCDKYYANGYGLRKHRRTVHDKIPKEKNKICDICGRGFHTNRILINHRRTHTGERPFQCSLCPHAFAQRVALEAHRRSQHKGANVKEYILKTDNISMPIVL